MALPRHDDQRLFQQQLLRQAVVGRLACFADTAKS
jgi:hypothetical protein